VAALGLFSLLLFAFSVLDSHAVKASANNAIAKIFIIMIVLPKYASERSIVQVSPVNGENRRNVSSREDKSCQDQKERKLIERIVRATSTFHPVGVKYL